MDKVDKVRWKRRISIIDKVVKKMDKVETKGGEGG